MQKLLLLFFLTFSCLSSYEHDLAISAIFRDDAPYLTEWIDFHLKQGVKHFYLYDNFSSDNPKEVLLDYINSGVVEVIPWPYNHTTHEEWVRVQNQAYMHCINRNKLFVKWLACLDTDEFLFCVNGKNLNEFLKQYDDYQILLVDWQLYGTSNIICEDYKIIDKLFMKAEPNYNVWTKAIVKPLYIVGCHFSHYFYCKNQTLCVDEDKIHLSVFKCSDKKPKISKIRINHYFCRDRDFFEKVKLKRVVQQGRNPQNLMDEEQKCNLIYDDAILRAL